VLLQRRTNTWPAHLKCRYKGKAVIVRIGNINPGGWSGGQAAAFSLWLRRLLSVLALAAAVLAFGLIVDGQLKEDSLGEPFQQPLAAGPDSGPGTVGTAAAHPVNHAEASRYRALSDYLATRYRVSQEVAFNLVRLAHRVGREVQVDPLLIIAVMAVESSFNPIAESVAGAKGLMQIIPKYHGDKLKPYGGEQAVFDPATNIQVGARILKEYIRSTGNVGIALQMYAGALGDNDDEYTNRVLGMKQRLQYVAAHSPNRLGPGAAIRTASKHDSGASVLQID
jgi:soluble lytic murein transglycosylase-like protein